MLDIYVNVSIVTHRMPYSMGKSGEYERRNDGRFWRTPAMTLTPAQYRRRQRRYRAACLALTIAVVVGVLVEYLSEM